MGEEDVFDVGETAIIKLVVKDADTLVLTDPDTVKITIMLGSVVKVTAQDMTKDSTGNYRYDYTNSVAGRYDITIVAVQTGVSRTTKQTDSFYVV